MQQSGKGTASGSGPDPALSDEQAEQFASSFTPAWDSESEEDGAPPSPDPHPQLGLDAPTLNLADKTAVDAIAPGAVQAAIAAHAAAAAAERHGVDATQPIARFNPKQTLIGTAPPANAANGAAVAAAHAHVETPRAEVVESENILNGNTAPMAVIMPTRVPAEPRQVPSRPPPAPAAALNGNAAAGAPRGSTRPTGMVASQASARQADPFKSAGRAKSADQSDSFDAVPKKSKAVYFVLGALVLAAGAGVFVKFGMAEDSKSPPAAVATAMGPAATTAEIPPPPPKVDTPPPAATTTAAAKVEPSPPPPPPAPPLAAPPVTRDAPAARQPVAAAPREPAQPRQPRTPVAAAPPPPVTPPPLPPAAPKTPPTPPKGGIVRDSPF